RAEVVITMVEMHLAGDLVGLKGVVTFRSAADGLPTDAAVEATDEDVVPDHDHAADIGDLGPCQIGDFGRDDVLLNQGKAAAARRSGAGLEVQHAAVVKPHVDM